ncbi:MAG: SUMF1/EgtB/PvdO family nonheme iron enzyme, partial [Ignavibacteriaceae bacterium]|nr:SUMF1/EgtB/PvdO family nonheme iron enzyme [Ignavibacteriaceae bacterium]
KAEIVNWRKVEKAKLDYKEVNYNSKEVQWIRNDFIQTQMMAQDRSFYDPVKNEYTVDKYIDEITSKYGGLNSILIWPTYPNIGIDNRNEFDWIRCMPGGLDGVKKMVAQFHKHGIKVLFPYNPWDIGTRREPLGDSETYAKILKYIDADGINGDVTSGLGDHWRNIFNHAKKGLVIEPELDNDNKYLEYDQMGWGYWDYPFIPSISKMKWVEPRHMVHVCDRWARDHTNNLQYAFFNGSGFETWENIWSIYNEMTPRASETVKRISKIYGYFYKLLTGEGWEPHYRMLNWGVFASKWSGPDGCLWTIVNRNDYAVSAHQMKIPHKNGTSYYDIWHGCKLVPVSEFGDNTLSFEIEPNGYGAILAISDSLVDDNLRNLLSQMNELAKIKLSDYSNQWKTVPQEIVKIDSTVKADYTPDGMIEIPAAQYVMDVYGIELEGGESAGVDVQMPGEDAARKYHHFVVDISKFYIDKYPVTNKEFKKFMDATHYTPVDKINFLKDWKKGRYPAGWENKPVTWVDIEDARAYSKWAGKRLPHEWEWQYAAQGTDGRTFPWGNEWKASAVPVPDSSHELRGPDSVNAHPDGRSKFGVEDMVGNVWQWTDEYADVHTRTAILRGGSYYQPQGSYWYFPQAYRLNEHGKYLLMSPGQNRAGTLGFRCVKD